MDREHTARDEAHQLAEEALVEMKSGNADEARFVLQEARRLDAEAVEDVLHSQGDKIVHKAKAQ